MEELRNWEYPTQSKIFPWKIFFKTSENWRNPQGTLKVAHYDFVEIKGCDNWKIISTGFELQNIESGDQGKTDVFGFANLESFLDTSYWYWVL